jgi:excisionase family DNA binding protein
VEDQLSPGVLALARVLAAGLTATAPAEDKADRRPPYTVPEAAALLRVHESTLYRAIQNGDLAAYSVGSGGRAIRIPACELDAFKSRRAIQATQTSDL